MADEEKIVIVDVPQTVSESKPIADEPPERPMNLWEREILVLSEVPDLTDHEEIFCEHYAVYSNGIQAYKRAYPDSKTQNAATAACQYLKRDDIRLRINQIRADRLRRLRADGDKILVEIGKIAFYDKMKTYSPTGDKLREFDQDSDTVNALRPKPADKLKALELLGRHQRLFVDRVEHDGPLTVEVVKFSEIGPDGRIYTQSAPGTNTDEQAMRNVNGKAYYIKDIPKDASDSPSE